MELTAKELKEALNKVKDDTIIRFQWIKDEYILGRQENPTWKGKKKESAILGIVDNRNGWETYDMECDEGFCSEYGYNEKYCQLCPSRNRYITASRCFIHDNQLFIDGHY